MYKKCARYGPAGHEIAFPIHLCSAPQVLMCFDLEERGHGGAKCVP